MPTVRKWMIPAAGTVAFALILWGFWGEGTARKLLPEKEKESSLQVTESVPEEAGPQRRYDASLHRRGRPLQDPFHVDAVLEAQKEKAGPAVSGRSEVLPQPETRTVSKAEAARPVLKGVMLYGNDRRAVLEMNGNTAVLKKGERTGSWTVSDIQERTVTLSSEKETLFLGTR